MGSIVSKALIGSVVGFIVGVASSRRLCAMGIDINVIMITSIVVFTVIGYLIGANIGLRPTGREKVWAALTIIAVIAGFGIAGVLFIKYLFDYFRGAVGLMAALGFIVVYMITR